MAIVNYNERSWAIDLITDINLWIASRNILIKRAGGENTLKSGSRSLFPDVLLFGDLDKGRILQGWELKMPDTSLEDAEFIENAKLKAKLLSLNSFLLWNVSNAVLYKIEENDMLIIVKTWNNLSHVKTREEVLQHKTEINTMLEEILNDINNFISNGTVKSTSVVTALSSEAVFGLVQNNLPAYAEALKVATTTDTEFSDEITLWWRYAKNDYPEEKDKFIVLARNNLLFLVNKFLFAHILKSYQVDAGVVDTISHGTDIGKAIATFNSISEKCDFWNIFQSQKGEELIPVETWSDILNFNELLKEFNFSKIEKSLLHDLIGLTVYRNKRKFAGQFTTPPELAKLIVQLTIRDKTQHAIDPCCGTGTIAKEIYSFKKSQIGTEKALASLWASDKFSLPLQMAMFNLADPEALGYLMRVFKCDAVKLEVSQRIELREPFKGTTVNETLPKFGYIISNLPFVQHEDLGELNPDALEINKIIEEKLGAEFMLDGKSDLYAYLPFHFWNLLEENGHISIIVSNSWLGTAWGEKFYKALGGFFEIENVVISGNGRWFNNAKVVTTIVTLKKKTQVVFPTGNEITKFIITKKKLNDYNAENLNEISALVSSNNSINESDISISSYSNNKIDRILSLGLNLNSFFSDNDWLVEFSKKLIKVSDFFDIVRGERRGWDPLFYPSQDNQIEEQYLKPVLKTPRSIHNLIAGSDAIAFCCDKSKDELRELGHTGALAWINKFEGQANENGVPLTTSLAKRGIHWYTMLPSALGEMVTSVNFGDRLFFARFENPTFVNQRLVRFTRKSEDIDTKLCHALMNSIVSLFYIEAMGTGRGEGALDLSKDKIEDGLRIVNPDLISDADKTKIIHLFKKLETREILTIEDELEKEDRIEFDNAVLGAIGCTEYRDKIKQSLLNLYRIRTTINL